VLKAAQDATALGCGTRRCGRLSGGPRGISVWDRGGGRPLIARRLAAPFPHAGRSVPQRRSATAGCDIASVLIEIGV
jgi:hypothetical protein